MRFLVAPALVLSTVGVLGTGIAMIAFGRRGIIVGLHKASFVVWAFAFGIHFLVYLPRVWRAIHGRIHGGRLRLGILGASVLAGVALAALTFPIARPWLHRHHHDHGEAAVLRR